MPEAMAKFLETDIGKKVMQSFSADVYRDGQLKSAGYDNALGAGPVWQGAVANDAPSPRVQGGNYYTQSAADSENSASPFTNSPSAVDAKKHASAITHENVQVLMKKINPDTASR